MACKLTDFSSSLLLFWNRKNHRYLLCDIHRLLYNLVNDSKFNSIETERFNFLFVYTFTYLKYTDCVKKSWSATFFHVFNKLSLSFLSFDIF